MRIRFSVKLENTEFQEHMRARRIEFDRLRKQMEMIFTFCPNYILSNNMDNVEKAPFVGVLLDVQITGTDRLIQKYKKMPEGGIYKVTFTLNAYLSTIFESVHYWGGDVLKIYGDRCLNMWKVASNESLYEVLHLVVLCSHIIRSSLRNFDTCVTQKLNMKMSIACGNIYATCFGVNNKLLLFRGRPLEEIHKLRSVVKPGDILISSNAWAHMIAERYHVEIVNESSVKLLDGNIVYKANERDINQAFNVKEMEILKIIARHLEFMKTMHSLQIDSLETMSKLRRMFVEHIPSRKAITEALCFGDFDTIRSFVFENVQRHINEHHPVEYMTELTTVTAQMILITPNSIECMSDAFVKHIYSEVNKSLEATRAFIYMFEVTAVVKIIVIRGVEAVRQDMESKRALKFGYNLNKKFMDVLGVDWISVGIFQGYLFCGILGHPFRRDYVALGSVLSKGFKILERNKAKVICDYKTFKFSKLSSFCFRCIRKRTCNVTFDAGQLMEYIECADEEEKKSQEFKTYEIYGRKREVDSINRVLQSDDPFTQGLVFEGRSKIGKTTMLKFIKKHTEKSNNFNVVSFALLKASSTPFSAVCNIYDQLYTIKSSYYKDIGTFFNLPSELIKRHRHSYDSDSGKEALSKYQILEDLKNLIRFETSRTLVIMIKNIQFMDDLSWEVLELAMDRCKLRFFGTADFAIGSSLRLVSNTLETKLATNVHIQLHRLSPLSDYWINNLACNLLEVAAIDRNISAMITSTCKGRPGYVPDCLTYLINCQNHVVSYMKKENLSSSFVTLRMKEFATLPDEIAVMAAKFDETADDDMIDKCTIASITKEFYFSQRPFDQAVLQTSAVLGTLFSRDLLVLAMHSPDEDELLKSIKTMFSEGIFECGSTYINGQSINFNKYCCRCYMQPETALKVGDNRYMYCKLLHFKNEDLKSIAYSMIPENEKKDLHLFCTNVLENSVHFCPACLRDPINSFVVAPRYKEIVQYCSGNNIPMTSCPTESSEPLKQCIRQLVHNLRDCRKPDNCQLVLPLRPVFDPLRCNCIDMLLFVYQNLMYHGNCAKHIGKQIFFYSIYGYLLILSKDYTEGIAILREAFELCMVNVHLPTCEISPNFRKFNVGRICMMMTSALISMRKISQAKSQMAVALRQYNIPSLVFKYNTFHCLLKKGYLVNTRCGQQGILKPTWMHWEIGMCFIICAKIFAIEGNLSSARNCAKYSAWVLKQINERIPILFEAYCNVVELYRYGLDQEVCEKLQKFVTKEVLLNYCNDRGYYAKHLMSLLIVDFEIKVTRAKLKDAIWTSYRIIDATLKFYVYASNYDVVIWFSLIFTYTMRFKQYLDLMNVIRKNVQEELTIWYFSNALEITILTGYAFVPIHSLVSKILNWLEQQHKHKDKSWETSYLASLVYLHMAKVENFEKAVKVKPDSVINTINLRRPIVMRIFLNCIEADLMEMWYKMQNDYSYKKLLTTLNKQLEMAMKSAKHMPIFYPRLHCLKAWKYQLVGDSKKAKKELIKAEKVSVKQGNFYFKCFVTRLRDYWNGNPSMARYTNRIEVPLDTIQFHNKDEWAHVLIPFPILK